MPSAIHTQIHHAPSRSSTRWFFYYKYFPCAVNHVHFTTPQYVHCLYGIGLANAITFLLSLTPYLLRGDPKSSFSIMWSGCKSSLLLSSVLLSLLLLWLSSKTIAHIKSSARIANNSVFANRSVEPSDGFGRGNKLDKNFDHQKKFKKKKHCSLKRS